MSTMMSAGDRFKCNDENGHTGTIQSCSYNSIFGEWEYYVKWDHIATTYSYTVNDVKDLWEKISEIKDSVDSGIYGVDPSSPMGDKQYVNPLYCNHKWVDVGFRHSKVVCSICDTEKV